MKLLMHAILFVLALFMLFGCQESLPNESSNQPVEPILDLPLDENTPDSFSNVLTSTLEAVDVADGFDFSLYVMEGNPLLKDKYFTVQFKEVIYQPIKNQVCIIFDYDDEDYERATYYMMGREKGSLLTAQQLSYIVSNPMGEHGGCFNFMTEQTTYEILIGKIDQDDLNPTSHMEAVAFIEFMDSNYDVRDKLGSSTLAFGPSIDYTYDQMPSVSLDITFEDYNQIIDNVVIKLFEESSNRLLETYIVPSHLLKWELNHLVIKDYIIDNLAPYVDYRVKVYVSGFNGIEAFTEVNLIDRTFKSQNITYSKGYRRHGFFAEVIQVEHNETLATIHYIAANDPNIVSSIDKSPYTFHLKIYDALEQLVFDTPIDVTKNQISIPISYAAVGNKIIITTDRDDIKFYELIIDEPVPQIEFNDIKHNVLNGYILNGQDSINFIAVLIFEHPDDAHFDEAEINVFTSDNLISIQLSNNQIYQLVDEVLVLFIINYGDPEDPQIFSREVWVKIN